MRGDTAAGKAVDKLPRNQRAGDGAGGVDDIVGGPACQRHPGKFGKIDLVEQQPGDAEPRYHRQAHEPEPEPAVAHHGTPPPVIDPVDGYDVTGAVVDAGRRGRGSDSFEPGPVLIARPRCQAPDEGDKQDDRYQWQDKPERAPVIECQQRDDRGRADRFRYIHSELCQRQRAPARRDVAPCHCRRVDMGRHALAEQPQQKKAKNQCGDRKHLTEKQRADAQAADD